MRSEGLHPVIERALGQTGRLLRTARDFPRDFKGLVHQLVRRHAQAHQPDTLGFLAVDEIGRNEIVLRLRQSAQQRPQDDRVIAGGDAEAQMAVGDAHRFGGDRDVGHERHRQARADRDAIDRRNDDLLAIDDVVNDVARLAHRLRDVGVVALHRLDHVEVAAGRKRATLAGDDDDVGLGIVVDVLPHPAQLPMQAGVGRIEHVGAVDRDEQDAVIVACEFEKLEFVVLHRPVLQKRWASFARLLCANFARAAGGARQPKAARIPAASKS